MTSARARRVCRVAAAAAGCVALVAVSGCGGGDEGSAGGKPVLRVAAAEELRAALAPGATRFADATVRYTFGRSDRLALRIRDGAKFDVFLSLDDAASEGVHRAGLTDRPLRVATEELVLAARRGATKVRDTRNAGDPGVRIAIAAPTTPLGRISRSAMAQLPRSSRRRVEANARVAARSGAEVAQLVRSGAADAGFVFASLVLDADGGLEAYHLPRSLDTVARAYYSAAILTRAAEPLAATAYVYDLLTGDANSALQVAGILPAPAGRP